MMSGWGWGAFSWTMYLGMIVFWVGIIVLVIWAVRSLMAAGVAQTAPQSTRETAADVLKRRYAAGEIDTAEFEQKRRDLF